MTYSPPTGTVALSIGSVLGYTPPVGAATLSIGHSDALDRVGVIVGIAPAPIGALLARNPEGIVIAGVAGAPTGFLSLTYDANLLSAMTALTGGRWQEGVTTNPGPVTRWQEGERTLAGGPSRWQEGALLTDSANVYWQPGATLNQSAIPVWQAAGSLNSATMPHWQAAERVDRTSADTWRDAEARRESVAQSWRDLPLLPIAADSLWQDGMLQTQHYAEGFTDGARLDAVVMEVWQPAGYPGNMPNPGPEIPPVIPTPWGTGLRLRCPLPGTRLRIGRTPCILIADREVAIRRTYMSINSASLVRLPDLTPLPVTAMTIETDFESWCWGFSATLAGPDAWALVQPNPLACEVLATINGQEWKFLLDVPSTNRAFNSDQVSLKGRSRSAWLHDPYSRSTDFSETNARTMQQLGEAALLNTGWSLDWQGEDWLVPAGRYNSWNTPMGVLIRLAQVTDDGIYTEPALQVLRLVRRWPVASWALDAETADLAIPESAVISLTQSPVYTPPINGIYVSGISHGAMALVKIAGTDGALQPDEPITHELLCDEAGVGARQRGLNALSDAGAGYELDAELLFTEEVGLVRPGLIVSIAGVKGVSRSCRISAQWSGDGLTVQQSVGLERREVEA